MKIALYVGLLVSVWICVALAWRSVVVRTALSDAWRGIRTRRISLATLSVIYGLVTIPSLAILTPPYQVSDEGAHFLRADDVELGHAVGVRSGHNSGGVVDQGISDSFSVFYPIILHPEHKATATMSDQAATIGWGNGKNFSDFANTSIYPPIFYSLSSLSIAIGKTIGLTVTTTLVLARILNGLVGVGLGALSIALAGVTGPWFFVLLTLPMTLAQMASASQDALMFPTAAVAAALFVRLLRTERSDPSGLALLTLLLAAVSMGRVTNGTLALLPLVLHRHRWSFRMIGAGVVALAAVSWSWVASAYALVQFGPPEANASAQIHYLLADPLKIFELAANTAKYQYDLYLESFVGKLGWLDLRLPWSYLVAAWCLIVLGAIASWTTVDGTRRSGVVTGVVALSLVTSCAALFAALYISWTPVGNFIVDGVQGRYFIPLAFFVPALWATGSRPLTRRIGGPAEILVALFPLVTVPVVLMSIVSRYYES